MEVQDHSNGAPLKTKEPCEETKKDGQKLVDNSGCHGLIYSYILMYVCTCRLSAHKDLWLCPCMYVYLRIDNGKMLQPLTQNLLAKGSLHQKEVCTTGSICWSVAIGGSPP